MALAASQLDGLAEEQIQRHKAKQAVTQTRESAFTPQQGGASPSPALSSPTEPARPPFAERPSVRRNDSQHASGSASADAQALWVETDLITIRPNHNRIWFVEIDELAKSMYGRNQIEPAILRPHASIPNHFELIAGARRWHAAKLNGEPLFSLVKAYTDDEADIVMWKENEERQSISPIEEAISLQRSIDDGRYASVTQMAIVLNVNRATLTQRMKPAKLPQELIDAIKNPNGINLYMAVELLRLSGEGFTKELIDLMPRIESDDTSRLSIKSLRHAVQKARSGAPKRKPSAKIVAQTGQEIARLRTSPEGTRVLVLNSKVVTDDIYRKVEEFMRSLIINKA
jgi:ParB/RepB/Spo0J family partition protein